MVLNLGCGGRLLDGAVNVDRVALPGVDVVWDLDVHPWPWPDGSVDRVAANHIFEHVDDPVGFVGEAWRVLEPGGQLGVEVPHWRHPDAFTDPTHRRFCTPQTFDYWCRGTVLGDVQGEAFHGGRWFAKAGFFENGAVLRWLLVKQP